MIAADDFAPTLADQRASLATMDAAGLGLVVPMLVANATYGIDRLSAADPIAAGRLAAAMVVSAAPPTAVTAARFDRVREKLRAATAELVELDKVAPAEVASIVGSLVAHLRSWRPESVSPLGTLPPPTDPEAIRDPREVAP